MALSGSLAFGASSRHAAKTITPPVSPAKPVSFRLDVMPVFFRAGCNSGGCHGAAIGKDGFHLSLFGYDPAGDYFRLTRQIIGRRIDIAVPEESLLLLKAVGKVPHTGGRRFAPNSELYNTLLHWIEQGAKDDAAGVPQVIGISVVPDKVIFTGKETKRPLAVVAKYSDGSTRQVSALALYLTNNKTTADINDQGVVSAGKRGDTFVFARFAKYTAGAEVIVLPKDKFKWPKIAPNNYIDGLVFAKLQKLHIAPSGLANDEEFLRRAYLDLIGLPPTPAAHDAFVKDRNPTKRAQLIDELMARTEFADVWATQWAETLKLTNTTGNDTAGTDLKAIYSYYDWIRDQMRRDVPLDRFAKTQIQAVGSTFENPAANLYTMLPQGNYDPKAMAQDVTQVFTGVRIQCAQCHNHPFDRWTQDDYYSFVSFFTGVKRKPGAEPREVYVYTDPHAAPAKHLLDGRPMPPRYLGESSEITAKDPRVKLAEWLTSKDNAMFRENMANRLWAHFMGRGIVEPVDDVRISNPPSNRELIEELGRRLASYDFDARKLVRDICLSRTYQLSSTPNATNRDDDSQFSHARLRRLRADVLLDAIDEATDTTTTFGGDYPRGMRAIELYEGIRRNGNYFLKTFGLAARDSVNVSETRLEPTLAQALHLINGDTIEGKLGRSTVISKMLKEHEKPVEIIDALYLRSLGRTPSTMERQKLLALTTGHEADRKVYDDIFWALLNSTEFAFNH